MHAESDEPAFEELLGKYREMLEMRVATDAGGDAVPTRMRALASRFPGALRELERLPTEAIRLRVEELERGDRPEWARAQVVFHGWMRVALRIKRVFRPKSDVNEVLEWLAVEHRPSAGEPGLEELDSATIESILRPPGGRLSVWLRERITEERGLTFEVVPRRVCDARNA